MKKRILLIILFILNCKQPVNYWNPNVDFPRLESNGALNKEARTKFNLHNVPDNIDILLINFFAPECKPCIMEVPDLKKIYLTMNTHKNMSFIAIGSKITALSGENIANAESVVPDIYRFVHDFQLTYPTYVAVSEDLNSFGLTGFPETFILHRKENKQWFVKRRFIGAITEKDVSPFLH